MQSRVWWKGQEREGRERVSGKDEGCRKRGKEGEGEVEGMRVVEREGRRERGRWWERRTE